MTNIRDSVMKLMAAGLLTATALAPMAAEAQTSARRKHQQSNKNNWRNLGYAGAAVAGLGLLKGNSTLTMLGLVGGGYSAYRYEQDRKSQSASDRRRAALYSRRSFTHNGQHFVRKTSWKNGKKYYTFVRSK